MEWVASVQTGCLLLLRKLFDAAAASGTHSGMTPKPASFVEEVDMVREKTENKQSDQ